MGTHRAHGGAHPTPAAWPFPPCLHLPAPSPSPCLLLNPNASSARCHLRSGDTKGLRDSGWLQQEDGERWQGGSAGQSGGSVSLHHPSCPHPPCRRLLGSAVLAGSAPLLCPPLPVMHRHLERPLMSMKYPSEQIAIELNLHQPPA